MKFPGNSQQTESRSIDPVKLRHQPDRGREHQRAMGHPTAENTFFGEFLIDMERIVIADKSGEQGDVAFTEGAATRAACGINFEIFEIKPQGIPLACCP